MNKFDEKLYHLLSEYHPEYKDRKLSQKAKHTYMTLISVYLSSDPDNVTWRLSFINQLTRVKVDKEFASALASIIDDWEFSDLEED